MLNKTPIALLLLTALMGSARADTLEDLKALRAEYYALSSELEDLDAAIAGVRSQISYYESLIASSAWWLPGTAASISAWQYEISRLRSILAALEAARVELYAELDAARTEYRRALKSAKNLLKAG